MADAGPPVGRADAPAGRAGCGRIWEVRGAIVLWIGWLAALLWVASRRHLVDPEAAFLVELLPGSAAADTPRDVAHLTQAAWGQLTGFMERPARLLAVLCLGLGGAALGLRIGAGLGARCAMAVVLVLASSPAAWSEGTAIGGSACWFALTVIAFLVLHILPGIGSRVATYAVTAAVALLPVLAGQWPAWTAAISLGDPASAAGGPWRALVPLLPGADLEAAFGLSPLIPAAAIGVALALLAIRAGWRAVGDLSVLAAGIVLPGVVLGDAATATPFLAAWLVPLAATVSRLVAADGAAAVHASIEAPDTALDGAPPSPAGLVFLWLFLIATPTTWAALDRARQPRVPAPEIAALDWTTRIGSPGWIIHRGPRRHVARYYERIAHRSPLVSMLTPDDADEGALVDRAVFAKIPIIAIVGPPGSLQTALERRYDVLPPVAEQPPAITVLRFRQ